MFQCSNALPLLTMNILSWKMVDIKKDSSWSFVSFNHDSVLLFTDSETEPNARCPEEVELRALSKALEYAKSMHFVNVLFLSDCLNVVDFMNDQDDCISWDFSFAYVCQITSQLDKQAYKSYGT